MLFIRRRRRRSAAEPKDLLFFGSKKAPLKRQINRYCHSERLILALKTQSR
jgi:hypothetical protein